MTTLDFLGGKYRQGEQILPGSVQTFRASEAATGRSVYVHRITPDDPAQHLALLRLLSETLLRSDNARKMVLEVGAEDGCSYIVTEAARQCMMLRQWLTLEANPSSANHDPAATQVIPRAPQPTPELSKEPGEFTRLFQSAPATPKQEPAPSPSIRPQPPVAPKPAEAEPGEFTRFFQVPSPTAKRESPSKSGYVQRPNSTPDLFKSPSAPTPSQGPGEYTRLFGPSSAPPPVQQPSTIAAPPAPSFDAPSFDAPLLNTSVPRVTPAPAPPVPKGPSEFTMVMQGVPRPQVPQPAANPPATAPSPLPNAVNPNKKLIILLVVLGVLAILLIVLVVLTLKK